VVTLETHKSIAIGQQVEPLGVSLRARQQLARSPSGITRASASLTALRLVRQETRLEEIPVVADGDKLVAEAIRRSDSSKIVLEPGLLISMPPA
jgi:hypothetical protein